jgi:hypothetical protein
MLYDPPKLGTLCAFAAGASKHAPASNPKASNLLLVVAIVLFMMLSFLRLSYCETPAAFLAWEFHRAHAAHWENGETRFPIVARCEVRAFQALLSLD